MLPNQLLEWLAGGFELPDEAKKEYQAHRYSTSFGKGMLALATVTLAGFGAGVYLRDYRLGLVVFGALFLVGFAAVVRRSRRRRIAYERRLAAEREADRTPGQPTD